MTRRRIENEIPADDPGEQLAERRVGVGIGGARDGDHRRELGVAQRREHAGDACRDKRQHQGGAGAIVGRDSGQHEDAGADDRPDAEAGQLNRTEHAMKPLFAAQLVVEHRQRLP